MEHVETLRPSRLAWRRAISDPSLRDLPYKIETNEYGQLVMSPVKLVHGRRQARIVELLSALVAEPGRAAVEIGVDTARGVKVPDVAWMSDARWTQQPTDAEVTLVAPEICIEVLSRSNTKREIDEKRQLYFACGAEEFWTCDPEGRIRFFGPSGDLPSSRRVPGFPDNID